MPRRLQRAPVPEARGQPRFGVRGGRGRRAQAAPRRPPRRLRVGLQPPGGPRLPRRLREGPPLRSPPLRRAEGGPARGRADAVDLPRRRAHRHAPALPLLREERPLGRRVPYVGRARQVRVGRRAHQGPSARDRPPCAEVVERISARVKVREQAHSPALSAPRLPKEHGDERLEAACAHALPRLTSPRCRHLKAVPDSSLDGGRRRPPPNGAARGPRATSAEPTTTGTWCMR